MGNSMRTSHNVRLVILFTILGLLLIGLWYDRRVARPGVEAAWLKIDALNKRVNEQPKPQAMTNADVQQALLRKPSRTVIRGPYRVEVYSWMAGIPFRTRDYYAVYNPGPGQLLFATHYKYEIPPGELDDRRTPSGEGQPSPGDVMAGHGDGRAGPTLAAPVAAGSLDGPRQAAMDSEAEIPAEEPAMLEPPAEQGATPAEERPPSEAADEAVTPDGAEGNPPALETPDAASAGSPSETDGPEPIDAGADARG